MRWQHRVRHDAEKLCSDEALHHDTAVATGRVRNLKILKSAKWMFMGKAFPCGRALGLGRPLLRGDPRLCENPSGQCWRERLYDAAISNGSVPASSDEVGQLVVEGT